MSATVVEECASPGPVRTGPAACVHTLRAPRGSARSVRKDLQSSVADAAGCGVMVGTGETYVPAFALAAGLGEVIAGLVVSIPQLAGGITQLISPHAVRLFRSHRQWVVVCASVQALAFAPLVIAAWHGSVTAAIVMGAATLYWSAGLASGPPWNTWMGTIVPGMVRPRYFARRTRVQQAAVLLGFVISGIAIERAARVDNALAGFVIVFVLALVCRLFSVSNLARTSEPQPMPSNVRHIPLRQLLRRFCRGAEAQRLLYLSLVQGAAYFATPYFTPYMLRVLKLSYCEYMILISAAYFAKVVSVSLWGGVAARFGVRKLLWIGGLGIVPSAALWMLSSSFWFLIFAQLCGGVAWAAYELAVFLICFSSVRAEERTSVLTLFNLTTTSAMVAGSVLGGAALLLFGATRPVYFVLFGGSSLLRLGTVLFLRRIPARLIEPKAAAARTRRIAPPVLLDGDPLVAHLNPVADEAGEWIGVPGRALQRAA